MTTMQAEDYFEDEEDYDFWKDYSDSDYTDYDSDYTDEQEHTNRVSPLSTSLSMLSSSSSLSAY